MHLRDIVCKILVDGREAAEYEASEEGATKSCYIASAEGKPFAFHVDVTHPRYYGYDLEIDLVADGDVCRRTHQKIMPPYAVPMTWASSCRPAPNSGWGSALFEERPFKFGKLSTVEAAPAKSKIETRMDALKELGTLKVVIWRSQFLGYVSQGTPFAAAPAAGSSTADTKPILEKQLKGRSVPHRTALGDPTFANRLTSRTRRIEPALATFVFNYSSEESLKMQQIIPATPELESPLQPSRSVSEKRSSDSRPPLEEMTLEQMRNELRRRREEEDAAASGDDRPHKTKKVKDEKVPVKEEKKKTQVKKEEREERKPRIPKGPIETIDLTDD